MNITMFNKMTLSDLKIYLLNSVALVVSFSEIEAVLKIILLLGSIVYTAQRIYANYQENIGDKKKWIILHTKNLILQTCLEVVR